MNGISERIARLSPGQRALLAKKLQREKSKGSLQGKKREPSDAGIKPYPRQGDPPRLPQSFSQERFWFLQQWAPESSSYNDFQAFRLAGRLHAGILDEALAEIFRRHEVLRASFRQHAGEADLVVSPHPPSPLRVVDLEGLPESAKDGETRRSLQAEHERAFDLTLGPMLRIVLFRLGEESHVLAFTMHHIVTDGRSWDVLLSELAALYGAFFSAAPSPLPGLPFQFADFAIWQRERFARGAFEKQLAYWRRQLDGAPPLLELPTDRPRGEVQSMEGVQVSVEVGSRLSAEVAVLARNEGVTPFMILLAGFETLLARLSTQSDIVVGTPIVGRSQKGTERLIGPFLNTIVLRVDLSGDPPFRELVDRVRRTAVGGYANQDLPFEKLVAALDPDRTLRHAPLFQVIFDFQEAPKIAMGFTGVRLEPLVVESRTTLTDLQFQMSTDGKALHGELYYSRALFDHTTILRFLDAYRRLLAAAALDPAAPIGDLDLLGPAQRQELVSEWNDTARSSTEAPRVVHRLFEAQAGERPDAVAVAAGRQQRTYGEINRCSARLACHLAGKGVTRGAWVGVYLDRCAELVVALLGILRAGAAYVPLDTRNPDERIRWIVEAMGITVLVSAGPRLPTLARLWPKLPGLGHVVAVDARRGSAPAPHPGRWTWLADVADPPGDGSRSLVSADDMAYVIFTSGSTGRPKGVMVRHRPVTNLIDWVNRTFGMTSADRGLFITSLSFDLSVYDVFGILAAGGTIRVASPAEVEDPRALAEIMVRESITFWDSAPAALQVVAPYFREAVPANGGSALSRVFLSGDWIPLALPGNVRSSYPGAQVIALGGATEATVWSNFYRVREISPHWVSIPYGRPIDAARYHVADPSLGPCPIGVHGDLFIAGECLATGYARAPGSTAWQFIPDPWTEAPGSVMYRTGDRARHFADGNLEFLGRLDHQVKIRGFRIELGEVEAALTEHPALELGLVLAPEIEGDRRLVAYLVPNRPADFEDPASRSELIADLRELLREKLPEYMLPSYFLVLDDLPVTANGKVDRGRLPLPQPSREVSAEAFVAPQSAVEQRLAEIWCQVLGLAEVGVHDNFFELGGDSILSLQVVSQAAQNGLRLSPRQIFEQPTVAGLAAVHEPVAGGAREEAGEPAAGPLPLTAVQRWFFAAVPAHPHHFNQSLLLELDRRIETTALVQAVEALGGHHDALRLRYEPPAAAGEAWLQVLETPEHSGVPRAVPEVDLSALPPARRRPALEAAAERVQASLDLVSGLLMRTVRYLLGTSDRLQLVLHHLVVDGVSWRILLEDLEILLSQLSRRRPTVLPPKTTSFSAWAAQMERYAGSPAVASQEDYWSALLARRPPALPVDMSSGPDNVASVGRIDTELDEEETRAMLQEVQRPYRTEVNDVLLTALAAAFGRWTGHSHLLLDLEGHGREELLDGVDLTRTVGWFTALYPVLLPAGDVEHAPGEALKSVKETLRAVPERGVGFGLLRYVAPSRVGVAGITPAPEVVFNYFGQLDQVLQGSGVLRPARESGGAERHPAQERTHLIEVNSGVREGRLKVSWSYSTQRHRRRTVAELAESFRENLRALIRHCLSPEAGGWTPSDFPLARIDAAALDRIVAATGDRLADLYPCSPLQAGMLYHSLRHPHSGVYVEQLDIALRGRLDASAFRRAWERLAERHAVLRTAFRLEDGAFLQVVHRRVDPEWRLDDWRGLGAGEQRARRATLLADDRRRGFALAEAPLMRFALIRMDDEVSRFLWTHHHALLDGWSLPVLFAELFAFYRAELGAAPPALSPPTPFRAYVAWLARQDHGGAEAFWRRRLAGFSEPTSFSHRATSAGEADPTSSLVELVLPAALSEALLRSARDSRVTPNTVLQGIWALLLGRYSGRDDVVFGVVSSGRSASLSGIESMVGMLINTQPARVDVSRTHRLAPWLERIQADQNETRRYEFTPLVEIRKWAEVPLDQPLFDSILVFENYPIGEALEEESGRLSFRVEDGRYIEQTNYPVTLVAQPGRELRVRLLYTLEVLGPPAARRLLGHFTTLLRGVVERPAATLDQLSLLTRAERHQMTVEWNDAAAEPAADPVLNRLFERQAARSPDAVAVGMGDRWLTYAELDRRANRLARYLRLLGVKRDAPVGICLERTPRMLVAILAVLKASGGYVPLDPSYPPERLDFMLRDALGAAPAGIVVTERGASGTLGHRPDVEMVCLDADARSIAAQRDSRPTVEVSSDQTAYVIYTSGSTGRPKGVVVSHRNVGRLMSSTEAWYGFDERDVWTLFHSYAFDFSVWEMWGALLYGGRLVVVPYWVSRSPEAFAQLLGDQRVTVLNQTPSAFRQLIEAEKRRAGTGLALRGVIFGGEALPLASLEPWFRRHGDRCPRLVNMYGITETTVHVTVRPLGRADLAEPRRSPIGRAISDLDLHVLDAAWRPVALGVAGELFVGGPGLSRGYLRRASLSGERFVPDGFGERPGARLYRTGDVVRRRSSGELDYVGRSDDQVKVRGYRIELGEIEACLSRFPEVRESLVLVRGDGERRRLVAFLRPAAKLEAEVVRERLRTRLPEYMVPSEIVTLDRFPLTPSGKVDRKALAELSAGPGSRPPPAPRSAVEETVAAVFAQVLDLDRSQVGAHSNFVDLGGHSLLATRVLSRLRDSLGVEVSLRRFLQAPTVEALARAAESDRRGGQASETPPLVPVQRAADGMPLSFAQERLWFLDQLEPASPTYNVPVALRIDGKFAAAALKRSLLALAHRHETLRTTFLARDGRGVQVVGQDPGHVLTIVDMTALDRDRIETELRLRAAAEVSRPFDLAAGPLFRATLLRIHDEAHVLVLTMHHIVTDGWSMGVLVDEVTACYRAFHEGTAPRLAELPVQYADFAVWQRSWLAGAELERQLGYWRRRLAGAPAVLELPLDRPRRLSPSFRGDARAVALPPALVGRLEVLGQGHGATAFMVLMAAWATLLARWSGQNDVVVGTPIAGRNRAEIEGLIGFFVNTLAFRIDLSGDPGFLALLAHVRRTALDAYAHQDLPFEKLVEELEVERSLDRSALFQVMLVLQNTPSARVELPGVRLGPLETPAPSSKFDLTLRLAQTAEGGQAAVFEYARDLFDPTTILRWARQFTAFLEAVTARPDRHLGELALPHLTQRHQFLVEWNDVGEPSADACLAHLFERQAARSPDAVAAVFEESWLSYRELDRRAGHLAYALRLKRVGPETPVGFLADRSLAMLEGLWGILKSGGAYVPLDPRLPRQRLELMLAEAGISVLVSAGSPPNSELPPGTDVVLLDRSPKTGPAPAIPASAVRPENPAYVIFTSGSTGKPKGVTVEHRQIVAYLRGVGRRMGWAAEARFALLQPITVDLSKTVLLPPFLGGGRLEVIAEERSLDPRALAEMLGRRPVDVMKITPSHLAALRNSPEPDAVLPDSRLVVGGEASRLDSMVELASRSRCRAFNHYGPTEATVGVLACRVEEGLRTGPTGTVPIGRPMAHSRAFVLGRRLEPLPWGTPGELCLGGASVARGYLGRPALTATRFVPAPGGARLYRTGDLVRYLDDGKVELLGRIDDQVKVRGFRVEPGEIEAAVCAHPAIAEALVVLREIGAGGPRLVAYVVGNEGAAADTGELRGFCRSRLPEHMVPAAFVVLPSLPRMAHGKVDRRALPSPDPRGAASGPAPAPRSPTEELVAGIWAQVLGLDEVDAEDDFFELGGHSLLATQVVARLRWTFALDVSLRQLFQTPTLGGFAAALDAGRHRGRAGGGPPIRPAPRSRALPLSFAQERLWLIDRLIPGNSAYNVPIALRLAGALETRALAHSLNEVARRHEVLRTTFAEAADGPVQVIAPAVPRPLPLVDLGSLERRTYEAELARLAGGEPRRAFDLGGGPLWRAVLLCRAPREHVLLVVLHHIVSDGWSRGILMRELGALYPAFSHAEPSPLAELPVQYADFACWQRAWLAGEELERQLGYWRRQLAGPPAPLELPADRPRPRVASLRGASLSAELDRGLAGGIVALGRDAGATLFMTLLAAWMSLLARYTGQDDVVVGSPVANRTRPEIEGLIGFFVNTLVMRADLCADPTFRQALGLVRRTALEAYAHQDLPFDRLVEEIEVDRALGRMPLFQVMMVLQNAPREALELADLRLESWQPDTGTAKFDLTLAAGETEDGLGIGLEYSVELFDTTTAKRLLAHYERLLAAAVEDPDVPLSDLTLLGRAERHALCGEWNDTATLYPGTRPVHELFAARARGVPERLAVIYGDEAISYGELAARAGLLARYLGRQGVEAGHLVGLCAERSVEMVVGMLGILEAGGAYVPLDPSYPGERLAFMVRDARLRVLLAQERLAGKLPAAGARVLPLDGDRPAAGPAAGTRRAVSADDLAYVIYTSGSTGTPKGVAVVHRAVVRLVLDTDYVRITAGDRLAQASNASFDAATFEIWGALLNGATVVGVAQDVVVSPGELAAWIRERRIGVAFLTTALFNQVSREAPAAFAAVRDLMFGGEAVDPGRVRAVLAAGPPSRLLHVYGPTENTTFSSWYRVGSVAAGAATVPIGRPIANSRLHVLDARLQPVPVGVAGELFVAGDGLAREYLGREELTRERFVGSPGLPGERLYKTGDVVRRLADGNVVFLGRRDHQVKLRGFRIELGEVEAVLGSSPAVREAAILLREDLPAGRGLVGYVVPAGGAADAEELRSFLRHRLPDYMIPAAFVALESLPLNANGKVDRAALSRERLPLPASGPRRVLTPVEEILAGIFAEVLETDRVGAGESFFELGGHSLVATRIVSRLRRTLGVDVALRDLFENPTVEGLAELVEARQAAGPGSEPPPIRLVPRDRALPLSFAQERLWFLDQLEPASSAYNVPVVLRAAGELSIAAFEGSLLALAERHETLRTTIRTEGGGGAQVIGAPPGRILSVVDLTALDRRRIEAETRRRSALEAARPFDLTAGPLFRAALFYCSAEEHVLVLALHHVVTDGWSMGILVRELTAGYEALARGRRPNLPALVVQYADYAVWQRRWLAGAELERQLDFWRGRLTGAPAMLELPADRPRPPVKRFRGAGRQATLGGELSAEVADLARRHGTTLFMTLLASWSALFSRLAGQDDVVLGSPIANRTRTELEGLIGFFANTLVMRTDTAGDPSFGELLGRVRRTTLAAYAHQDLPFERLVEELEVERSLDRTPLFQVMLVLQNAPSEAVEIPGLGWSPVRLPTRVSRFDLTLSSTETAQGIRIDAEFDTDLFDATTIERWIGHHRTLLAAQTAAPEEPLSTLPLLGGWQRHQLTIDWNDTAHALPGQCVEERAFANRGLHRYFEAQAARTPETVSLQFAGEHLSYRELNARANRLARRLRSLGVGPEVRVGLTLERSAELVVAFLAVHKAGGAYVPLDPAYPRRRLELIRDDAAVAVVLTVDHLLPPVPAAGVPAVCLGRDELSGWASEDLDGDALGHPAYVIYTSGSTGRPKGVVVSHDGILNHMLWMREALGFSPRDRFLQKTPLSFDASVWEFWAPLMIGARLVVARPDVHQDPAALVDTVRRHGITVLQTVPALLSAMLDDALEECGELRQVMCGGETLRAELRDRFLASRLDARLLNFYGPTEATVEVSSWRCESSDGPRPAPIGRPITNTSLRVADRRLRAVPIGVSGELLIGGAGLARGYLNRPNRTAEKFVPDPFAESAGRRLYRSGDLTALRPDGRIEFLGRFDHQVKLRGLRIELGEIEAALLAHPAVAEAAVMVRRMGAEDLRLTAWIVAGEKGNAGQPAARALEEDLRRALAARLPAYMVPSELALLEAMPLLPNGKVDRRALEGQARSRAGRRREAEAEAARNRTELELLRIWKDLLGHGSLGIHDNFFASGGHSLLAVRLVAQVRHRLGAEFPLSVLFQAPTVAEMAERIESSELSNPSGPLVSLKPTGSLPPLYLVHPVGGGVLCYQRLAQRMGDRPVFGLQARGVDDREPPRGRIEAMAEAYVEAVTARQPDGPYHLCGWSLGGLIAWEMARRITAAGERVALVALVDTVTPAFQWGARPPAIDDRHLLAILAREAGLPIAEDELADLSEDEARENLFRLAVESRLLPRSAEPEILRRLLAVYRSNMEAGQIYEAPSWNGNVVLFRAVETLDEAMAVRIARDPSYGWSRLAPALTVETVEGHHFCLLEEPQVADLAGKLESALAGVPDF